ncbi:hypothetical protein EP7_002008 [Isosphaeraceae bacterium EP7]
MHEFAWGGRILSGGTIAMAVEINEATHGRASTPTVALAAADTGADSCILQPGEIGPFLLSHRDRTFACYDSRMWFWSIADCVGEVGEPGQVLLELCRTNRIVDVRLLDQLVWLADGASSPVTRTLDELGHYRSDLYVGSAEAPIRTYGPSTGGAATESDSGSVTLLERACATREIEHALREQVDRICEEEGLDLGVICRHGPLGLGIEVRGAVTLARATRRGLRVRADQLETLDTQADQIYRASSLSLGRDARAQDCFRWDGEDVRLKDGKFPDARPKKLAILLGQAASNSTDERQLSIETPEDGDGNVSIDPRRWGDLIHLDPILEAWSQLTIAADLKVAMARLAGDRIFLPAYEVVPAIRAYNPDVVGLRRLVDAPIFEPGPGRKFLVLYLRDLELRCFAELVERQGGCSQLAGWFRAGIDPIAEVASRFHEPPLAGEEFTSEIAKDPAECRRLLAISETFLRGLTRGYSAAQSRVMLGLERGIEIDASKSAEYQRIMTAETGLERVYLPDDEVVLTLLRALACETSELASIIGRQRDEHDASLRNLISGRSRDRSLLRRMAAICRNPALRTVLESGSGSKALHEAIFSRSVVTATGRIVGGRAFAGVHRAILLDLADAVRKEVLFSVVEQGLCVAGAFHDQILIDAPAGPDDRAANSSLVTAATRAAAGSLRFTHDLFVIEVRDTY